MSKVTKGKKTNGIKTADEKRSDGWPQAKKMGWGSGVNLTQLDRVANSQRRLDRQDMNRPEEGPNPCQEIDVAQSDMNRGPGKGGKPGDPAPSIDRRERFIGDDGDVVEEILLGTQRSEQQTREGGTAVRMAKPDRQLSGAEENHIRAGTEQRAFERNQATNLKILQENYRKRKAMNIKSGTKEEVGSGKGKSDTRIGPGGKGSSWSRSIETGVYPSKKFVSAMEEALSAEETSQGVFDSPAFKIAESETTQGQMRELVLRFKLFLTSLFLPAGYEVLRKPTNKISSEDFGREFFAQAKALWESYEPHLGVHNTVTVLRLDDPTELEENDVRAN